MHHLYFLLLSMLALVILLIAADWFFRWRKEVRDEREQEDAWREARAKGLTDRRLWRRPSDAGKSGMIDNELVITVGVGVFSIGAAVVAGVLVFFFCGLVATWFVVAKQWALTVGNRRLSISSRQMGRVESATYSGVGKEHGGPMPEKDHAPNGAKRTTGSEIF